MEDESSSKAVTLLPSTHAAAAAEAQCSATTMTPPQHVEWGVGVGGGGSGDAASGTTSADPLTYHTTSAVPLFASDTPGTPPPVSAAPPTSGGRDSDTIEEPLFQHPPPIPTTFTRGGVSPGVRPWCAVSATPPSSVGVGGLFPASSMHSDVLPSTPAGQSLAVCRDLLNRLPSTAAGVKQRTAAVGRTAFTATYMDGASNSSTTNSNATGGDYVAGGGAAISNTAIGRTTGLGANRSLFRSVAQVGGAVPASPVIAPTQRWDHGGGSMATPVTPALAGGEAVLVSEPPPTPAKQRRTIHSQMGEGTGGAGLGYGTRVSGTMAAAGSAGYVGRTSSMFTGGGVGGGGAASPAKQSTRSVAPPHMQSTRGAPLMGGGTSPTTTTTSPPPPLPPAANAMTAAPSMTFKFHRREGSRKRSADVLSQFSALDLDETPSTPYGQTGGNGRFNSLSGGAHNFPSQPSSSMFALRCNTAQVPTSPLIAGYATPVTLSQQIGGSNTFSQMLLHPSQDILDMSQADTDCSNFLARRIVNDYNEVRLLGRGSFGTVSLYKEISSGDYVAVKMSPPLRAPDMERRYRRERSVMGLVRGMPHVVQLSAAWEEGRVPRMYLQLEYCPGGSLAALAAAKQARNETWSEEEVKTFLAHMGIALDAMHRADIAHVDFKPDNVLIDRDGAYKLSDFGCSVLLDRNGRPRPETQNGYGTAASPSRVQQQHSQQQRGGLNSNGVGGLTYNNNNSRRDGAEAGRFGVTDFQWAEATETSTASVDEGDCRYLCADMLNEKRHFKAGDMFSLGMSLYELMSGQPLPRNGDHFLALRRQVPAEMLRRRGYSAMLVRLVVALLHSDPTQRPTARQLLQFLRPSAAEMQLLSDASAMQAWTADATSFSALLQAQRQQHEDDQARESGTTLRPSTAALRCVSALVEASSWLLTTAQQDVHRALTAAEENEGEGNEEEEEETGRHRQPTVQQQQQPRPMHAPRGNLFGSELDDLPMSPIMREEACTPTTINY